MTAKKKSQPGSESGKDLNMLWWERMNVLHKYLPDEFPHFKEAPEPGAVQMARIQGVNLWFDKEGQLKWREDHSTIPLAAHTFQYLYNFANISGDGKKAYIRHGGAPLKFEAIDFVRTYAHRVYPEQMRELFAALEVPNDTARKYCKGFSSSFKIPYLSNFIRRIKEYSKAHPKIGVLSFQEIEDLFQISPRQLDEWSGDSSLKKLEITILTKQKKVTFPILR